ncbi:MAG: cellulase family glycosylhydrolase [Chloroflexi bacterium]|nr:cellulase family glycosylhydrolase [Chloroflexota bacterium]
MTTQPPISHALVLPNLDFLNWLKATDAYTKAFSRVVIVRSPAGNDLNRYRNITAVQAPGVWVGNDALSHIRRVYPSVVRVDVIRAATPAELAAILQQRITLTDRYGEKISPGNISDRFTLEWMSDARPASITRGFNETTTTETRPNEGIDVYAPLTTPIRAGAAGVVTSVVRIANNLGYGQYAQISTTMGGQSYVTTYARLNNIRVTIGQSVKVGDVIGESGSATQSIKVVVQQPGKGLSGYILPNVVDPTMMIYWQGLLLKINVTGLRIRERPGTDFKVIGQLTPFDRIETLEPHGRTLLKVGKENQWIKIRSPQTVEGYASAPYLMADETGGLNALNMTGINLDILHRLGKPAAARMKGTGFVRFAYSVSMGRGSTDLDAAYNLYAPYIQAYANAGLKVILVLTHQTYGEGAGYVWPNMDTGKWRELTAKFADFARRIAARFVSTGWVTAYQIWNEQDTPMNIASAAVPMQPTDYAYLLSESIKAIRAVDTKVKIITGGHVGGPFQGGNYARATVAALPGGILPDAIACHSYGRGPVGNKYSPFGSIDEDIDAYTKVMPGAQVWITEWGVLDRPNDPPNDVADYAVGFINRLKTLYSGKVACCVWYGWADTMHNGFGLVNQNDQPKQPFYDRFLSA